jgi:hypothetical protein
MKSVSGIVDYVSINNQCDKEYMEEYGYKRIGILTLDTAVNSDGECKKLMSDGN